MGWILPIFLVLFWQAASSLGIIQAEWLPAPLTIAHTLYELGRSGELWGHIGVTVLRVLIGFVIGAAAGTAAGALTGYSEKARRLFDPTLQALRNIPSMAWVPLFLLWLGIFEESKIALIATGVFFPVYLTLASGIEQVDRKLLEVGELFELDAGSQILRIILPAALPSWITALRSGLSLGWMFVVAAELMGASKGLVFLMYDAQQTSRADVIIASIVLFAILGKVSDGLLALSGTHLLRYQKAG